MSTDVRKIPFHGHVGDDLRHVDLAKTAASAAALDLGDDGVVDLLENLCNSIPKLCAVSI